MDAVEILFALENEFDINIPDEEVRSGPQCAPDVRRRGKLVAAKSDRGGRPVAHAARRHYRHRMRSARSAGMSRNSPKRSRQGRSGIGPLESADYQPLRFQNGAEVKGYTPPALL